MIDWRLATGNQRFLICTWLLSLSFSMAGQEQEIVLSVYDQEIGEPLIGATVVSLPNQHIAGYTDLEGVFLIPENWAGDDLLRISYLGYATQELSRSELLDAAFRVELVSNDGGIGVIIGGNPIEVVGRRGKNADEIPYSVEVLSRENIELDLPGNSADALAETGGVYVQKSQQGGGSPILRGFEANRVLMVVDGVRLNNAIFRNGHLQNAITVDVNALEQIEVISGPGSLEYGSDAIGGVIHFRSRKPDFNQGFGIRNLQLGSQYSTAAQHQQLRFGFEAGGSKLTSLTLVSLNRFGDLLAGSHRPADYPDFGLRPAYIQRINGQDSLLNNEDPNRQLTSGYDQLDLLHKQRLRLGDDWEAQFNFQFSTSSNIPRYDNLTEVRDGHLRWAEWEYGPQSRLLTSLRLEGRKATQFYDYASLIIARQAVQEDRIQRRLNDPIREISEVDVAQWTLQFDFDKSLESRQRLGYGIDARTDEVKAEAFLKDIESSGPPVIGGSTRYPSRGSNLSSIGSYIDYSLQTDNQWKFGTGLRFNHQWLSAFFGPNDPVQWPASYIEGIRNEQSSLSATASVQKRLPSGRLRFVWAQAFRAPNIDDFAKFRERNGRIQVPNPELRPERSNSLELGWDFRTSAGRSGEWDIKLLGFYSWLQDAIIRTDFALPDGSTSFVSRGDTLQVQANVNAQRARVFGVDLSINRAINQHWSIFTEAHWLRGRRLQTGPTGELWLPQDHIPPAYGRSYLRYQNGPWTGRLQARYQLRKQLADYAVSEISQIGDELVFDRTGTSDNLEQTPLDADTDGFAGAYGWWTLGFNLQYKPPNSPFSFRLGFDNILDKHYRTFGSGISAAGRDLSVGVVWKAL